MPKAYMAFDKKYLVYGLTQTAGMPEIQKKESLHTWILKYLYLIKEKTACAATVWGTAQGILYF